MILDPEAGHKVGQGNPGKERKGQGQKQNQTLTNSMKQPLELKRILVRIILLLVPVTLKMENYLRIQWMKQMAQWAAKKRTQTVLLMAIIQKV